MDFAAQWELLVAESWDNADLRARLMSEPEVVLAERGIEIPEGVELKVVADTKQVTHLVLPVPPSETELSEEELQAAAAVGASCRDCRADCRDCRCRDCRDCRCRDCRDCRCRCRAT